MRTLAALALVSALALTGCSQSDTQEAVDNAKGAVSSAAANVDLPDVDWSQYGDQLRTKIDDLAAQTDCQGLKAELTQHGKLDADVVAYIKAKLDQAGC